MTLVPLKPGDCLVYKPTSLLGKIIAIKSWMPFSHVEIVVDAQVAIGARPNGVARYPIRVDGLGVVMRPSAASLDMDAGIRWFQNYANGQRYDLWGLLRFFTLGKQSTDKMFCSELATRFYRKAGFPYLFGSTDADLVPPGWFASVVAAEGFEEVWRG